MIDPNKLCPGCMRTLEQQTGICPYCGYDREKEEQAGSARTLKPLTILAGKYLLGRVLGEGGFGITYLAWDLNMEMPVAIKEYFPVGLATRDARNASNEAISIMPGDKLTYYENGLKGFGQEARNLAKFRQLPGVVSVKELFFENQTAYLVMEYVEGISLSKYLEKNGPLSEKVTLEIMSPLLHALAQVHREGIIHRDISPDNIMVGEGGKVTLIDFGSARMSTGNETKSLTILLKHGYAPPEQYQTRGKQGPWTDIYALCATMYRMMSGHVPEESIDRMGEDLLKPLIQLKEGNPDVRVSSHVSQVISKGLRIQSGERYQSVEELIEDLYHPQREAVQEGAARGQKTPVKGQGKIGSGQKPGGGGANGKKQPPFNKKIFAAASAVAVCVIVAVVVLIGSVDRGGILKVITAKEPANPQSQTAADKKEAKASKDDKTEGTPGEDKDGEGDPAETGKPQQSATPAPNGGQKITPTPNVKNAVSDKTGTASMKQTPVPAVAQTEDPIPTEVPPTPTPVPQTPAPKPSQEEQKGGTEPGGQNDADKDVNPEATDKDKLDSVEQPRETATPTESPVPEDENDNKTTEEGGGFMSNTQPITPCMERIAAGGAFSLGVTADGRVIAKGTDSSGRLAVTEWRDIQAVAAGEGHTVGLKKDGTVVAAGDNAYGQCNVTDWQDIQAVAAGKEHTVGLKKDGTVVAVGDNASGQCNVEDWSGIKKIAAGSDFTAAVTEAGTALATGQNSAGQCNVSEWKDLIDIAAGPDFTAGLCQDNSVIAVGNNDKGQCSTETLKDIVAISCGSGQLTGLRRDGTVAAVGDNSSGQLNVETWTRMQAVSTAGGHTMGLTQDNKVYETGQYAEEGVSQGSPENTWDLQ